MEKMNDEEKIILYNTKRSIATITLNRPHMAHAFNWELMKGLYDHLIKAHEDENVKCILLKSSGDKVFSSGIDIRAASADDTDYLKKMREFGRKVTQTMLLMKEPIVVQVQGTAIGFGMELIMASDLRIFADKPIDEMFFRMPEIAIGIYPQTGATILPLLAFGLSYAKKLLFTSDRFGLDDLKNVNFPTRVFAPDRLEIETKKFMRTFSKRMESFMHLIKSSLTIMNNKFIERWYDLEDKCGEIAYEKHSQKEMDEIIKNLYKNYP
ncbi:MAG: putative Enoyl-CoA hydratase [Promethearchaeota archaeon]|nr:MAG: putative Enoyl-CoA hydratase [Candidatus Lokiarchaeota archaeon]